MPLFAGFLKPRKSRLRSSKSISNAKNFICSFYLSISTDFSKICTSNVSHSPKIAKKIHKHLYFGVQGHPRSLLWVPVYNFLLVTNSTLGLILHHFWDTATYWLKIANFSHLLSFSALAGGDPFRIYGKALRILKLESSSSQP